ncbi:MAG: type II secretion system F family protein [Gammaproteobacteria bacterium]|nr:type II secretion system F family protein [Gammaproteobacteria bacterium]MDE2139302.1 type II secretion system F family protein [Gammaproteobacteria bacterium]MDE2273346.1 type II secretion system F family protein [Gammaproteobacteria bacterium]
MAIAAVKQSNYFWEGTDKKGARIKGKTTASNESAVKADLRRQGIVPVRIRKESFLSALGRGKKIKAGDIAFFTRQLSTMMSAGVPLVQAIDIIGRGHANPRMRDMVLGIKADVESGNNLADSLGKQPLYFDHLYTNLVRAGEQSGTLETLLDRIATYKEKTEAIKKKIKKAMFYPAAVLIVAFIVTAILLIFVIPEFQSLFQGAGASLPAFTQMVINLSKSVRHEGWLYLLVIIAIIVGFVAVHKRSARFRELVDRLILRLPIIGMILNKACIARFTRTLSTMFAAGVNLVDALGSVAGATGNIIYEKATLKIRDQVSTGQQLNLAMAQAGIFPHTVVQMIGIGEEAGSIDTMASKVADFYEEEVDNAVDAMSSLMEPMIMVILGILVGGLVVAMYLPIFNLGNAF